MQNTSALSLLWPATARGGMWLSALVVAAILTLSGGCAEFVHWGHISDKEGTWGINDVAISQKQDDGSWKRIGGTDGKGRWEVFKQKIKGGGAVRLRKRGYYTITMSEAEFLQRHMILMSATGDDTFGDSEPGWGTDQS